MHKEVISVASSELYGVGIHVFLSACRLLKEPSHRLVSLAVSTLGYGPARLKLTILLQGSSITVKALFDMCPGIRTTSKLIVAQASAIKCCGRKVIHSHSIYPIFRKVPPAGWARRWQ